MAFFILLWDDETVQHIAEHGVTQAEFAEVVEFPDTTGFSRSSGRPFAIGTTSTGRTLFCAYEKVDEIYLRPVTAYEI